MIEREQIDEVIIADPAFPQQEAVELVDECHRRGVRVRIAPSTMEILVHRADFVPGEAVPLFELRSPVFEGFDWFVKRTFDVLGSVALLMLLSPVLALIAIAVKLTSRGPVLYHSMRPGIGGQPFACLKFRTMYRDPSRSSTSSSRTTRRTARSSRCATTRASRGSAGCCAASRSTSCRSAGRRGSGAGRRGSSNSAPEASLSEVADPERRRRAAADPRPHRPVEHRAAREGHGDRDQQRARQHQQRDRADARRSRLRSSTSNTGGRSSNSGTASPGHELGAVDEDLHRRRRDPHAHAAAVARVDELHRALLRGKRGRR